MLAAFCEGERLINSARADGDVSGPTDKRLKRMLWQTAGVLFPDNYRNEYGLDLIPGLNIGLGGSLRLLVHRSKQTDQVFLEKLMQNQRDSAATSES